jgi:hypothetical protein
MGQTAISCTDRREASPEGSLTGGKASPADKYRFQNSNNAETYEQLKTHCIREDFSNQF